MKRSVVAEQALLSFVEAKNGNRALNQPDFRERRVISEEFINQFKCKNKSENITLMRL
jgi:hypothetical protein